MGDLPEGYLGTQRTVEHIKELIRSGAQDFYLRQHAIDILMDRKVPAKDYLGEIRVLFEWVQRNIRYTKDPFRVEVLHSARRMLQLRAGDCDDMTIVLGSMLEAIGHPVRLVLVGPDPRQPRLFSHIYLEVYHSGHWLPLDATMRHPMGWAPGAWVKQVVTIERRPAAMDARQTLTGTVAPRTVRASLWAFIRAVRSEGLPARDPRVRIVWRVLQRRGLLVRRPRLQAWLRKIWREGLSARQRPGTAQWLRNRFASWGLIMPVRPPGAYSRTVYRRPSPAALQRDHRLAPPPGSVRRPGWRQGASRSRSRPR